LLVLRILANTSGVLEVAQGGTLSTANETGRDAVTEENKDSPGLFLVRRATAGLDTGRNVLLVLLVRANTSGVGDSAQGRSPCTAKETGRDGLGINISEEKSDESDTLGQHHRERSYESVRESGRSGEGLEGWQEWET
jgi:hypothetical protein